ncbi:MAG: ABC transporter permease [Oscillospiraceae bacterium]|nr:ABC transporter permease [Oscillospiraceae bacterium]
MNKAIHIAKANIRKQKGAVASMFVIIMLISILCTLGMSVMLGVMDDYEAGNERLNGLHSALVLPKDIYEPSMESTIKNDPHVTQYDIGEVVFNGRLPINYGGELEHRVIILNADEALNVSDPAISAADSAIPLDSAIYMPEYARRLGFEVGSSFDFTYRNNNINLTVAGFFESAEFTMPNGSALKLFASAECFEMLKEIMGSSVWIAIRYDDPYYSSVFNESLLSDISIEISFFTEDSYIENFEGAASNAITPTMILTAILLIFALVIILISLLVTRFRVTNSIEDSMHSIGVLKASGYTSRQIIAGYLVENAAIAIPAALAGFLLSIPSLSVVRKAIESMSGTKCTLGVNTIAGIIASIIVVALLLLMVMRSCRRIRKLMPVDALRGETAASNRRRNSFPLQKGAGGVHARLGLKGTSAYAKRYIMISIILAAATFVVIIIAALYQNFVLDQSALMRMIGIELAEADVSVAQHADADALAAELAQLPEVRKTAMLDWCAFRMDDVRVTGFLSDDYSLMETMLPHDGRAPKYDNEVAMPKLLASRLGKTLGDTVSIKANGQELGFIICGYYSCANNGGEMGLLTLEGYKRLDPEYRRNNIHVYLHKDAEYEAFADKIRAAYGDDILKVTDFLAWAEANISVYGDIVKLLTQVISLISLLIIALIIIMTARQIVSKRRRDLGIMKAGGYTTAQLTKQLVISFLPGSLIGIAAGAVCGTAMVNPAVTAMFTSTGVYNANVHIYSLAAAAIGAIVLVFTLAAVYVSASKIKRITVYELLAE